MGSPPRQKALSGHSRPLPRTAISPGRTSILLHTAPSLTSPHWAWVTAPLRLPLAPPPSVMFPSGCQPAPVEAPGNSGHKQREELGSQVARNTVRAEGGH